MIRVFGVNTKKSKFDTEEKIMDFSLLTPDKQVKYQYWLNVIHEYRASGLTLTKEAKNERLFYDFKQ